jgi:hypothetical protein
MTELSEFMVREDWTDSFKLDPKPSVSSATLRMPSHGRLPMSAQWLEKPR